MAWRKIGILIGLIRWSLLNEDLTSEYLTEHRRRFATRNRITPR